MSLLHWNQISFPGPFFWGLQTASSRWGPDLENRVVGEVIRSAFHVVLLQSTCDTVHCLGERALFSSSFVAVSFFFFFFWRFLLSNVPIMLYNICYWWFFLSQGNQWTKYLAHPKKRRPKHCMLMFVSLVALNGFHLLLFTQLTTDLTPDWSGRSMFHPSSHIYTKTAFCCVETVAKNALNRRRVVVFDRQLSHSANAHAKYTAIWYLRLLRYLTQLQFTIGQNDFVEFFGVFPDNCRIWRSESSASFVSIRPRLKSAYHLLTFVSDGTESK